MFRTLIAAALAAAALTLTPAAPATAVTGPHAPHQPQTVQQIAHNRAAAAGAPMGTLAQRNAYVRCVAPATEVSYTLRVRLLSYASKALEGIRARVPAATVTAGLRKLYHLTVTEASRVYWCTVRVWGTR